MKNQWILIALVFSMTVNVAVLGTLIYYWSQQDKHEPLPPNFRGIRTPRFEFGLDEKQREEMRLATQEHRLRMMEINDSLRVRRRALMDMLFAESVDTKAIDKAIEELTECQLELERATIHHLLAMRPILGPEQWQQLVRAIETRMPGAGMRRFKDRPRFDRQRRFYQPDTVSPR